jgi:hypothetical protein
VQLRPSSGALVPEPGGIAVFWTGTRTIARPLTTRDQGRPRLRARKARIVLPRSAGRPQRVADEHHVPGVGGKQLPGPARPLRAPVEPRRRPRFTTSSDHDRPTDVGASDERQRRNKSGRVLAHPPTLLLDLDLLS